MDVATRVLDPATGATLWEQPFLGLRTPAWRNLLPVWIESAIVFIEATTGERRHHVEMPENPGATVLSGDLLVSLESDPGRTPLIRVTDIATGRTTWESTASAELDAFLRSLGPPARLAVSESRLVLFGGSQVGGLSIAAGGTDVTLSWRTQVPEMPLMPPTAHGDAWYFLHRGRIVALDARSGSVRFDVSDPSLADAFEALGLQTGAVYGDCLAYVVRGGGLCLFDLTDGRLRARIPDVDGAPLVVGDALVMIGGRHVRVFGWS
jgi:hypothetical protein